MRALDIETLFHTLESTICFELAQKDTEFPLFHGSWDWHSCVHGYWAALWLSRWSGNCDTAEQLQSRLSGTSLQAELEFLKQNPSFELPYGRSWLLRLGVEYIHQGGTLDLGDVAHSVKSWLRTTTISWLESEYQNPIWALIQLWDWFDVQQHHSGIEWCKRTSESFLALPPPTLLEDFQSKPAFFSRWALWVLLATKAGHAISLPEAKNEKRALQVVTEMPSVHHLGLNPSRAWGLWVAYSQTGYAPFLDAYRKHIRFSQKQMLQYQTDRYAYTHWVPQFITYALWLQSLNDRDHSMLKAVDR
ncbi:MAG: DUF2891 family protein [Myxococcota bacterium]|nr:DUF2891 family protein [Myxococcota bacterium]